jgi:hypothetical protein
MPAEIRTDPEHGHGTAIHIPTVPTVKIQVKRELMTQYLKGQSPVFPVSIDDDANEVYTRVYLHNRWAHGWVNPNPHPAPTGPTQNDNDPLLEFYNVRAVRDDAWNAYQILGKTPHADLPDQIVPWTCIQKHLGWRELQGPEHALPENGCYLYDIDTGWFEAMDVYAFIYGSRYGSQKERLKHLSMDNSDFPLRYRKACLFTDMFKNWISTDARFNYSGDNPRSEDVPLLRVKARVGFYGSNAIIRDVVVSAFFDQHDIGFAIDMTTGEYTDLGDPATEEFYANVRLKGNWFMPSALDHNRKSNRMCQNLYPGMRFSDLFTDHAQRAVAEGVIASSTDWNETVSCDTDFPYGFIAGYTRIKRTPLEDWYKCSADYDPKESLHLEINQDTKSLIDALRTNFSVGSTIRQNGLALTSTSAAVKNEDHHLLECVSKGTTVHKSRWREPEHKRVYTVENAEAFKSYLVEGQESNAESDSVLQGINQWDLLMSLGKMVETFNDWIKTASKEDQKVIRQWEKKNPDKICKWKPFSQPFLKVKLEVS